MYVCVCNAVTERQIHHAARSGAKTVKHLKEVLNVGTDCGRCVSCAKTCLKVAHSEPQTQPLAKKLIHIAPMQLGVA